MNSIGNDNYKPGLEPPEPILPRTGWLSSNVAQLMVFLNGLILTVTAFATLSVFINQIVTEGLQKTTEEVHEHVVSGYEGAEKSLRALSAMVGMSHNISKEKLVHYVSQETADTQYFEQIYWIKNASGFGWDITALVAKSDENYFGDSQKAFIDFIKLQASGTKRETYLTLNIPGIGQELKNDSPRIFSRPFALIRPIKQAGRRVGFLVGVSDINNFVTVEWAGGIKSLRGVEIIDTEADLPIYSYQALSDSLLLSPAEHYDVISSDLAGHNIESTIRLLIPTREAFLQKIPLLMLLFGITLTLIGTLYVRNNQSQSQRLSKVNKKLAHKNFELNQEMSERERLNLVMQKSEREHRAMVNSVSDIIFEISSEGVIIFLSKSWLKVTGFEQEKFIGRNLFELLYVQDQEDQRRKFDRLVEGKEKSYRSFTRLRSADGSFRAVELALSMIREDEETQELRAVGTITDMEEHRRAEEALGEAERKYREIVENAASGIYQVTPEGQFLSANPSFAMIMGFSSPEEVLRDITDANEQLYIDVQKRDKFLRDVSMQLNTSRSFEGQIRQQDGTVIWVHETVRPVKDDEGRLLYFEGSMEDIDQRKIAEIALTTAKAESDLANRSKSEFLANMSHELRTPLNAIIGFSEIIKNESFGVLPQKEYKEYAENIHDSGRGLLNVINEILDVSRIEAGERTLNEGVVNIKSVVESALALLETKIKSKKIRIENKVKDTKLGFVGETQSVKQMLVNLMSNAVKFSQSESLMMIDAELNSKGDLRLSVTDTGVGLNEDEIEKALSPFGQLDAEHKRSKSGTGLGLTLVKSLVGLHGGEFELVSQKGIGTTATLIFPAARVMASKDVEKQNSANEDIEDIIQDTKNGNDEGTADVF